MTASDKKTDELAAAVSRLKNPTRHTGFRLTPSGDTRQEFQVKRSDSWLERWLALHAARDAANMTNPQGDAIAGKLGGPLSLGLSEAISNKLSLGDTKAERRETLRDAVDDVEDSTYRQALVSGLKSSVPYALAGGAGGLVTSAYKMTRPGGQDIGGRDIAKSVGVGAGIGIGASVLRSLLQKAILDTVSNKAKRKAIAIKADMPMTTSLPFGDAIAAAIHPISKQANSRRPRNPRQTFQTKSLPVSKEQPAAKSEVSSYSIQKPSLLDLYKKEPTLKLPTPAEVEPASNLLTRVLESDIAKKIGDRLSLSGGLRLGSGSEVQFRPSSISLTHRF